MNSLARQIIDKYFIKQPRLRRLVTRSLEADINVHVSLFGTKIVANSIQEHGYVRAARAARRHSVLADEGAVLITLAAILQAGDTFVDVGANVGLFACTVARLSAVAGQIQVYAFEPNPATFQRLQASCAELDVQLFQNAVSDQHRDVEFVSGAVSHVFSSAENRNAYHFTRQRGVNVRSVPLNDCDIKGDSIIIKIDVEGEEFAVLRGASALFDAHRVKAVYVDGYKDPGVPEYLTVRGFKLFDGRTGVRMEQPGFSLLALRLT